MKCGCTWKTLPALVTSGACSYLGVATGIGAAVRQASAEAYRVARKVVVPNLRYRSNIGERVASQDWERLAALGWLDLGPPRG